MQLKFTVNAKIQKPVAEVFDAVYDPKKLSSYFTTGGSNGPLDEGQTVIWQFADYPGEVPVTVEQTIPNQLIAFAWGEQHVRIEFKPLDDGGTLVTISEGEWPETQKGLDRSYGNCHGWTQMTCCLKAFVEHGINLRDGFY